MSNRSKSVTEVFNDIRKIEIELPYIKKCIRTIHQANVSNVHELSFLFDYDGTAGEYKKYDISTPKKKHKRR